MVDMESDFEKLDVYKDAIEFAKKIYSITNAFPRNEMLGLTSQIRKASISIPGNIAEGSSRTRGEFIRFLNMALGSTYECIPLLEVSSRQRYIGYDQYAHLIEELQELSLKINALKNSLKN